MHTPTAPFQTSGHNRSIAALLATGFACALALLCTLVLSPSSGIEQAHAAASAKAVKWLKGNWYTSSTGPSRYAKVKFSKTHVKYYKKSGGSWKLSRKSPITKAKKTKRGFDVYVKESWGTVRYAGKTRQGKKNLDYFYRSGGDWRYIGGDSLIRK